MKGIFGKSSKNPAEVVRNLKEDLLVLEKGNDGKKQEKVRMFIKIYIYIFRENLVKYYIFSCINIYEVNLKRHYNENIDLILIQCLCKYGI